jgi:hypothetical protein
MLATAQKKTSSVLSSKTAMSCTCCVGLLADLMKFHNVIISQPIGRKFGERFSQPEFQSIYAFE